MRTSRYNAQSVQLTLVDWAVVALYFLFNLAIGFYYKSRAGSNISEFFLSGRNVPWWLAGTSMVATTFAADTPLAVTGMVAVGGIAGNWLWWCFVASGMLTVFFYARLWRRSGVMTDIEFSEIRYSGKPAAFLRGFRALYLGIPINCIILGWVNKAMVDILMLVLGVTKLQALAIVIGMIALTSFISTLSGLWGVLVTDMFQFVIKMSMVIALAVFAVRAVGGIDEMKAKLAVIDATRGHQGSVLNFVPDLNSAWMPLITFLVYISLNWWATWYPGAEPGGGSYIAQRMLASKSEKDSLGAVLFFNVAHYVLRPWPWILVGLCSLLVYPELADIQKAFPHLDPKLLGNDIAYPAMLRFLPVGFIGLMVGGLIAANSSTILTHLNWGASYLVHDFYQRFIHKGAGEKHYVLVGRLTTIGLFVCAAGTVYLLDTAKAAFDIILQVGAGTGLLYLVRWFWWRVNAWCEVMAMVSSFAVSVTLLVLRRSGIDISTHYALLITIAFTTLCWVLTAFIGPQTDRRTLIEFYRKVRPFGPGWRRIREAAGVSEEAARATHENIPLALLGWVAGCTAIWSALFTVGNVLYRRTVPAVALLCVFVVSGLVLRYVMNRLWSDSRGRA
ncbi:MAG: Na+:solute symporter [Acidobacteriia bacterium]|nr:Na+:solute symporter [Terriglobia bacterium]